MLQLGFTENIVTETTHWGKRKNGVLASYWESVGFFKQLQYMRGWHSVNSVWLRFEKTAMEYDHQALHKCTCLTTLGKVSPMACDG